MDRDILEASVDGGSTPGHEILDVTDSSVSNVNMQSNITITEQLGDITINSVICDEWNALAMPVKTEPIDYTISTANAVISHAPVTNEGEAPTSSGYVHGLPWP